jgi:tetratricopeptide (TPR) repeat protein
MDDKWPFKFRQRPPIEGKPVTLEEAEEFLLAKLNDPAWNPHHAKLELVIFYGSTNRVTDAMRHADEYLAESTDLEEKAGMYFYQGQLMEHIRDWESAIRFYSKALEFRSQDEINRYFIHNNIGFSLNQLKRYSEAEKYLREAIALDPSRANAFKNLGLSLEGQSRFGDAARSFMAAVQADASDPRALKHLEELAERHTELYVDIPDLSHQITRCREVVEYVAELYSKDKPPIN